MAYHEYSSFGEEVIVGDAADQRLLDLALAVIIRPLDGARSALVKRPVLGQPAPRTPTALRHDGAEGGI